MSYDIIGDIHGQLDALERLLERLGYERSDGVWRHPQRQALFLGDLIDRGPRSRDVVATVRRMVEAGHARCVMGNHELNAIAYHTRDPRQPDQWLRPHSPKNVAQHEATLASYAGYEEKLASDLAWFRELPFWLDLGDLRLIHAAWRPQAIETVVANGVRGMPDWPERRPDAFDEASELGAALDTLLKGVEWSLPQGLTFTDKDGHERDEVRVRWWNAEPGMTWAEVGFGPPELLAALPRDPVPADYPRLHYPSDAPPVFFGHYWLTGQPEPQAPDVACLDYSVGRGGDLVAYRWDGEATLETEKFWRVPADPAERSV